MELSKQAQKPNEKLTDEQWKTAVAEFVEPAYEGLAFAGLGTEDYDKCADNFKLAAASLPAPDPSLFVRMGNCYRLGKHYDEAVAALDKAINDQRSVDVIKQVATKEKGLALAAKAAAK
jgi:tetratricopeptide (TPR) repeat protein